MIKYDEQIAYFVLSLLWSLAVLPCAINRVTYSLSKRFQASSELQLCAISIEGAWWCTSSQVLCPAQFRFLFLSCKVVEVLGCWRGRDILSLMVRMKKVPVQELRLCASSLLSLLKKCEADTAILTEIRKGAKYVILYRLREVPLLLNAFSKEWIKFDQLLMEVTFGGES